MLLLWGGGCLGRRQLQLDREVDGRMDGRLDGRMGRGGEVR